MHYKNIKMKKTLKVISLFLLLAAISIIVFLYILGMFKDNKTYCSKYIPYIEKYYKTHGEYPKNLYSFKKSFIDVRYKEEDCGYEYNETSYSFFSSDGFIEIVVYSSVDKKWWYD